MKNYYGLTWLKHFNIGGFAIGNYVFYQQADPPQWLINHENKHVKQYNEMSPFGFMPAGIIIYGVRWWAELLLGLLCYRNFTDAYRRISIEIEAQQAEFK